MGAGVTHRKFADIELKRAQSHPAIQEELSSEWSGLKPCASHKTLFVAERFALAYNDAKKNAFQYETATVTQTLHDLMLHRVHHNLENTPQSSSNALHASARPFKQYMRLYLHKLPRATRSYSHDIDDERYDMYLAQPPSARPESHLITLCSQAIESALKENDGQIDSILDHVYLPNRLAE